MKDVIGDKGIRIFVDKVVGENNVSAGTVPMTGSGPSVSCWSWLVKQPVYRYVCYI